MKRITFMLTAFILTLPRCFSPFTAFADSVRHGERDAEPIPKVILDTDIAYLNDDAIAMFMLAQADKAGMLEFLGVTTAGGNVFVPEATTAALRQLELIGREDIPVYQGTDEPLDGFRGMREESRLYGIPYYSGAYWDFESNDFYGLVPALQRLPSSAKRTASRVRRNAGPGRNSLGFHPAAGA